MAMAAARDAAHPLDLLVKTCRATEKRATSVPDPEHELFKTVEQFDESLRRELENRCVLQFEREIVHSDSGSCSEGETPDENIVEKYFTDCNIFGKSLRAR